MINKQNIVYTVAIVAVGGLLIANQFLIMQIGRAMMGGQHSGEMELTGDFAKDVAALVTPIAMPFYGSELGLDFSSMSAINASISKMGIMAPMQGSNPIQLTPEEMKRYIKIGTEPYITCEFCCGVMTLVREDGSPTCSCAHSIAMRGTAAYLIKNHPELSDANISYELMRQKGMYFPTQMQKRMAESLAGEKANFTNDIAYLAMKLSDDELADLKQKATGSGFTPQTQSPDMVGGC